MMAFAQRLKDRFGVEAFPVTEPGRYDLF